jgi:hypothetical protein
MTPQEADAAADKLAVLIERATLAAKAGKWAVAAEFMREAHELAKTLPMKETKQVQKPPLYSLGDELGKLQAGAPSPVDGKR